MVGRFGLPTCILMIPMKSMCSLAFVIILLCHIPQTLTSEDNDGKLLDANMFAAKLVEKFGSDGYISVQQLENLISSIQMQSQAKHEQQSHNEHDETKGSKHTATNGVGKHHISDCKASPDPEKCVGQLVCRSIVSLVLLYNFFH